MKKDILIEPVTNVEMAIVRQYNVEADENEWHIYLINNKDVDLEMVIMLSKGFSETQKTSVMRRRLDILPAMSSAKMEYIPEELFAFTNQFQVSFFHGGHIHEIDFQFEAGSIKSEYLQKIGYLGKEGIFAAKISKTEQ